MKQVQEVQEVDEEITPYVEWDDTIRLPSRKERHTVQKENVVSPVDVKPKSKEALRKRRIRLVRKVRFIRSVRRIFAWGIAIVILLLVGFWWKFVYVYDLPDYLQVTHPQMKGYIAWKSWTFGPPILDLRSNGNPHTENEIAQYLIKMDTYKDVIQNPFIIWTYKE